MSEDGVTGRRSGFRESSGRRKQVLLRELEEAVGWSVALGENDV